MKLSWFVSLTVLIVGLAVASWLIERKNNPDIPERSGKVIFATLGENLDKVTRISISGENGQFAIELDDKAIWRVPAMEGYLAKPGLVRETLLNLSDLTFLEPRTRQPKLFSQLGLSSPEEAESRARLLQLADNNDQILAEILIGLRGPKLGGDRDSVYVRLLGEEQAWLAQGIIDPPSQVLGWVEREFIHIAENRIQSILIETSNGTPIRVKRTPHPEIREPSEGSSQSQNWLLESHSPSEIQIDYSRLNALGYGLEYVSFENVMRRSKEMSTKLLARYTTFDGLVVTVEEAISSTAQDNKEQEGNPPLIFKIYYDPDLVIKNAKKDNQIDMSPQKNDISVVTKLKQDDDDGNKEAFAENIDARAEAERLSQNLDLWAFEVADYVQKRYRKTMSDLVKVSLDSPSVKKP